MEILGRGTIGFWRSARRDAHLRHPRKALPRPNESRSNTFPRNERAKLDPEASAFFRSKTAGNTRQNRRKPSQKSVDVSGVQNRSFTSRKSIHLRFQHPQKMRAPTARPFTLFHSAPPDPNGRVVTEPGSPGRAGACSK